MKRAVVICLLALTACSRVFGLDSPVRALDGNDDSDPGCGDWWNTAYSARFPITVTGAPAGYTIRVDATEPFAHALDATKGDVRVVVDDGSPHEIDRVIESPHVVLRTPAAGALWIYVGNILAPAPPANESAVYAWAESFETMVAGSDGSPRFTPQPSNQWTVVDDNGNHVYRASGSGRNTAQSQWSAVADLELRTRMRVLAGGALQHSGLIVRSNSLVPSTIDGFIGQLQADISQVRIAEYVNGASPPTDLATSPFTVTRDVWYRVRVRVVGDVIELFVDDTLALTATKTGSDGNLAGLIGFECNVDFDDVRARPVVEPEPSVILGSAESRPCTP